MRREEGRRGGWAVAAQPWDSVWRHTDHVVKPARQCLLPCFPMWTEIRPKEESRGSIAPRQPRRAAQTMQLPTGFSLGDSAQGPRVTLPARPQVPLPVRPRVTLPAESQVTVPARSLDLQSKQCRLPPASPRGPQLEGLKPLYQPNVPKGVKSLYRRNGLGQHVPTCRANNAPVHRPRPRGMASALGPVRAPRPSVSLLSDLDSQGKQCSHPPDSPRSHGVGCSRPDQGVVIGRHIRVTTSALRPRLAGQTLQPHAGVSPAVISSHVAGCLR